MRPQACFQQGPLLVLDTFHFLLIIFLSDDLIHPESMLLVPVTFTNHEV
jgi:hypothetical protein